jgi:RimJ/RimL family protein N-acetyltransferase
MVDSPKDSDFSKRETDRLVLRAIRVDDWQSVHRYMSDPVVTRWLPEVILDQEQSREFAVKNAGENFQAVAVLTRDPKEFVGHTSALSQKNPDSGKVAAVLRLYTKPK